MGSISMTSVYESYGSNFGWSNSALTGWREIGPEYDVEVDYGSGGDITHYSVEHVADAYCVYKLSVSKSSAEALSKITFRLNMRHDGIAPAYRQSYAHTVSTVCRVYDFDPSGQSSAPSGAIASQTKSVLLPSNAVTQAIFELSASFEASTLYVRVDVTNTMPFAWIYDRYGTAYGVYARFEEAAYANVSGEFPQQSLDLNLQASSVETGSGLPMTITNHGGLPLTLTIFYGETTIDTISVSAASENPRTYSLTAKKSWFDTAGVTQLTSITIGVTASDGTRFSSRKSFTLRAGSDMKPSIGTPTFTDMKTGRAATNFPNTWIAGISEAKVQVAVNFPTNAGAASVALSVGGNTYSMSYNGSSGKYEATTQPLAAGSNTLTITATDVRGLLARGTAALPAVQSYRKPWITLKSLYRCDQNGTETEGGAYCRIKVVAGYDDGLSGNAVTLLTAKVGNSAAIGLTSNQEQQLTGLSNANSAYTVYVSIQDKVVGESVTREFTLPGAHKDFVLLHDDNGVGFGGRIVTHLGIGMEPSLVRPDDGNGYVAETIQFPNDGVDLVFGNGFLRLRYFDGHVHVGVGIEPDTLGKTYDTIQLPSGAKIIIGGSVKLS